VLNNIIEKIRPYLSRPLQSECEVVYVMAEIRKVLEQHDASGLPRLNVLNLFCNWALHTASYKDSTNIKVYFSAYDLKSDMTPEEFLDSRFFKEIMNLAIMKKELGEFLNIHRLPDVLLKCEQWSNFVDLYTGVVSEVPMRYTKNDLLPDEIEDIMLMKIDHGNELQPFARWTVQLKNGRVFSEDILYRTSGRDET
jgi:hypothetical protein